MSYTIDKFRQMREARKLNRFGSVASLTAQGVGNEMAGAKSGPAKKRAAKKTTAKKSAATKKAVAKKTTAKKS